MRAAKRADSSLLAPVTTIFPVAKIRAVVLGSLHVCMHIYIYIYIYIYNARIYAYTHNVCVCEGDISSLLAPLLGSRTTYKNGRCCFRVATYIHTYIHTHMHIYIYIYIYLHLYIYVFIHTLHIDIYTIIHIHVHIQFCRPVCVYACMRI